LKKEEREIKRLLSIYQVPLCDKVNIEHVLSAGHQYMEKDNFCPTNFQTLFLSQIRYIPLSFWLSQSIILMLALSFIIYAGFTKVEFFYPLTVIFIVIPLIVLINVTELSKSFRYGMWEIEQSSKNQLHKLVGFRMLIMGLIDLFMITILIFIIGHYYNHNVISLALYIIVPFNVSCSLYLIISIFTKEKDISYMLVSCFVFLIAVFSIIMRQKVLFEISMIGAWGIFYLISFMLLTITIKKYLNQEKLNGESVWN